MTRWTTERPTRAGVYWNKHPSGLVQIVEVVQLRSGQLAVNCTGDTDLSRYTGEWQPVAEPEA